MGAHLKKPFAALKVALLADELTRTSLDYECRIKNVTPLNYRWIFRLWRPDLLLVESAWQGWRNAWKYQIASYPDHPKRTNHKLLRMVHVARDQGIPTVFWNKEDGVHFKRFIDSARCFDHIFTVDENCLPYYRQEVGEAISVMPLMFAIQPEIHHPGISIQTFRPQGCFVGSYSRHLHKRRQQWQDMLFQSAASVGLHVFDRNSARKAQYYRYPAIPGLKIMSAVPYRRTADIYRSHLFSLNVNTVENSPTMFSRRLIEIMACAGLAITTPAMAVDRHFSGLCHVVRSEEEARELFTRLRFGRTSNDREMSLAAAEMVLKNHAWSHRLATMVESVL